MKISSPITNFHLIAWPTLAIVFCFVIGFEYTKAFPNHLVWGVLVFVIPGWISLYFTNAEIDEDGIVFSRYGIAFHVCWHEFHSFKYVSYTKSLNLKLNFERNGKIRSLIVVLPFRYIFGQGFEELDQLLKEKIDSQQVSPYNSGQSLRD